MKSSSGAPLPYKGALSSEAASQGIKVVQANAARLARDAKLLLESQRYASAAMVAVMALEEISRVAYPVEILTAGNGRRLADSWYRFRKGEHLFPWAILAHQERLLDDSELNAMLSFVKKLGLKAECIEPGLWIDPGELVSAEFAASVVGIAQSLCTGPISQESVDVWVQLVGSLPKNASTKVIMKKFQSALESKGLVAQASMARHINDHYDAIREHLDTGRSAE